MRVLCPTDCPTLLSFRTSASPWAPRHHWFFVPAETWNPTRTTKRRESPGSPQLPGLPVGGTWTLQGLGNPKVTTQQRRVFCFFVVVVTCWRFMEKDLGMDVYFFSFKCLSNDMAVCTQDASEWNSLISLDIKQMKEVSVLQCQHTHGAISATSRTAALEAASIKIFPQKKCWRSG